ncbi:MAG: cysteine peptidase family C39 domain-containing protein [Pirellula sp.]|nr:cysteine peptidase family C39 domain-containing protein [Pirellula sp.]
MSTPAYCQANLCGAECLYVALLSLKPDASPSHFKDFQKQMPIVGENGYSMATLQDVAVRSGLNANLFRLSSDELIRYAKHNLVIVRISVEGGYHFVLCDGYEGGSFEMFDSTFQRHLMSRFQLEKKWGGECLVLSIGEPRLDSAWNYRLVLSVVVLFFISIGTCFLLSRRWRGSAFSIVLLTLCVGCSDDRPRTTPAKSGDTLSVVGPSTIDLGQIGNNALMVNSLRPSIQKFPVLYAAAGESITSSFRIEGEQAKMVTVQSLIDSVNKDVEVEHKAVLDSGDCSLNLHVGQSVQPGLYYGVVDVVSPENSKPLLRIPWSLRVIAPVVVSPKEAIFVTPDDSENATAQLLIETDSPALSEGLEMLPIPSELKMSVYIKKASGESSQIVDLSIQSEDLKQLSGIKLRTQSGFERVLKVRW